MLRGPGHRGYALIHWSYVGAGVPWQHTGLWQPTVKPAPTEPDRIAALEQRVAERDRAQSVLVAALVKRLEALEGVQADGTVPAKVPGGIAALEQRVAELEAQMRPTAETFEQPELSYQRAKAEQLRSQAALLLAQANLVEAQP
jgi:hypothetical protein